MLTAIRYGLTIGIGNFQTIKLEAEATPDKGDTDATCYDKLRAAIHTLGKLEYDKHAVLDGRAPAPGFNFETSVGPAAAPVATTAAKKPTKRATATKAQPAETAPADPNSKKSWTKSDWENFVAGFDSAALLSNYNSVKADAELYHDLAAWRLCCEAFAARARSIMGPDDPNRPEMAAAIKGEMARLRDPEGKTTKVEDATPKPKASRRVSKARASA